MSETSLQAERLRIHEERALLLAFVVVSIAVAYALEATAMTVLTVSVPLLFVPCRRARLATPPLVEGAVAVVGLAIAIPIGLARRDSALALSIFLLIAMATKVLAPRTERDRSTAALVGLVLSGVAASEAVEPEFAGLFAAALGTLGAFAAIRALRFRSRDDERRDAELFRSPHRRKKAPLDSAAALELPAPPRNRVWVGRPTLGRRAMAWGLVSAFMIVSTSAFFLAFPRVGAKLLTNQRRASTERLSGFADRVGLNDIGRIKQNTAVAFRVEVEGGRDPLAGEPYWRGRALDSYDGRTWNVSRYFRWTGQRLNVEGRLTFYDPLYRTPRGVKSRKVSFYLEPLGTRCLFTFGEVERFHFKTARPYRITRDAMGSFFTAQGYSTPMAYETTSYSSAHRLPLNPAITKGIQRTCKQLPQQVDQAKIRAYAEAVLRRRGLSRRSDPERIAQALADHLSKEFRYTLEGLRDPETEPVSQFLFKTRAGHCELFASAHALMLRTLKIPSRLVTGFRGGEWSDWAQAWTVRQSNAHAWTEVDTREGWVRFDPTPAEAPQPPKTSLMDALAALGDWLELRWFAYVIAFDAYDQKNAVRRFRLWLEELAGGGGEGPLRSGRSTPLLVGALVFALIGALLFGLRRLRGRGARSAAAARRAEGRPTSRAMTDLLTALKRRGFLRQPGETPLELALRAGPELGQAGPLERWIERTYAERYGERPLTQAEEAELSELLARLAASA